MADAWLRPAGKHEMLSGKREQKQEQAVGTEIRFGGRGKSALEPSSRKKKMKSVAQDRPDLTGTKAEKRKTSRSKERPQGAILLYRSSSQTQNEKFRFLDGEHKAKRESSRRRKLQQLGGQE
jgi:hypothetical protein